MAYIKSIKGKTPSWGEGCFLAENSTLVGDITMGENCSVWFGAVLRADVNAIKIGNGVNVQDLACIHQSHDTAVIIEDDVSIGHSAVVHAATIKRGALVGMNATVLDKVVVGENSIVAAGAVVVSGTHIPPNEIWGGIPAKKIMDVEAGVAKSYADNYIKIKAWYNEADTPPSNT